MISSQLLNPNPSEMLCSNRHSRQNLFDQFGHEKVFKYEKRHHKLNEENFKRSLRGADVSFEAQHSNRGPKM
jgi:hypothetical protein